VVAEVIRLKAVFFPAYHGRHPQSVEAVLGRILYLSFAEGFILIAFALIDNEMLILT